MQMSSCGLPLNLPSFASRTTGRRSDSRTRKLLSAAQDARYFWPFGFVAVVVVLRKEKRKVSISFPISTLICISRQLGCFIFVRQTPPPPLPRQSFGTTFGWRNWLTLLSIEEIRVISHTGSPEWTSTVTAIKIQLYRYKLYQGHFVK